MQLSPVGTVEVVQDHLVVVNKLAPPPTNLFCQLNDKEHHLWNLCLKSMEKLHLILSE